MTHSISLRPRALAEIAAARDRYGLVGHGDSFLDELEAVFEAIRVMPLRFRSYTARFTAPCFAAIHSRCSSASARTPRMSSCSPSFHSAAIRQSGQGAE